MQKDLNRLSDYFKSNKLLMNEKKTKYIIFKQKDLKLQNFSLSYNNANIERVSEFKYLGLVISNKLNFTSHIDHIKKKIVPFIGVIKRLRKSLPKKTLINIYYAHIHHLAFMSPIWANAPKYKLNTLSVLQNKVVKIILNKPFLTPTNTLYNDTVALILYHLYRVSSSVYKLHTDILAFRYK